MENTKVIFNINMNGFKGDAGGGICRHPVALERN